jgi:hypothetical protein
MKTFARRFAYVLIAIAALYLITVNAALNLLGTRDLLSHLQADSFNLSWRRAWSLYPLRVSLTGVAADGQTPTEQWQLDAERVAVSISLLPLLDGELHIHDIDLVDIGVRLRPRPKAAGTADAAAEAAALAVFYPVIRNRNPGASAEPVPEPAPDSLELVLAVNDIHLRGNHAFWISHIRGGIAGEVRGSFETNTGTGRIGLSGGALDLSLVSLQVGPDKPVTDGASIRGNVEIPPFVMSEKQGLELMRVLTLDASVDLPVENLDFLAILLPPLRAMEVTGAGQLRGQLRLDGGEILGGTDLTVEAHQLAMDLGPYAFRGDGSVEFVVSRERDSEADLIVRFDRVEALLEHDAKTPADAPETLFQGEGLTAQLHVAETDPTTTSTAREAAALIDEVYLALTLNIPVMQAQDLAVYNALLPAKWGLGLLGGSGEIHGRVELTDETLSLALDLSSDEAQVRYQDQKARTDLLLSLRARIDDRDGPTLDISGTRLRLDDAEVATAGPESPDVITSAPWAAELAIDRAELSLPGDDAETETMRAVAKTLVQQGFGALLGNADGVVDSRLTVNRLDWIAALLNRPMDLSLEGGGEIDADIHLVDGWPSKGSMLKIPREALSMALIDHRIDGNGEATLTLVESDEQPTVKLAVAFDDARLSRRDEPEPSIGEARMDATLLVDDLNDAKGSAELAMKIHSARVHDMSTYNAYLPPGLPFRIQSGEASLVSDLRLSADSAEGELELIADDIRLAMDQADVAGDLRLALLIRDGSSDDLHFDITGSSFHLDDFQVHGATADSQEASWYARLQLDDTKIRWQKPMHIDSNAEIVIRDTRPLLALMDNLRGKHGWVDDMLSMEDLAGHLKIRVDGERALLEDAMVSGPEIGVHAKGQAARDAREALLLLRWHNLMGTLRIVNDDKSFSVINPRAHFEAYQPGRTELAMGDSAPVAAIADSIPSVDSNADESATAAMPSKASKKPSGDDSRTNPFLDHSL